MQSKVNEIQNKILEINLKRFFYVPFFLAPLSLAHIIYFLYAMPESGSHEFIWRWSIIYSHIALISISLLMGLLSIVRRRYQLPGLFLSRILQFVFLFALVLAGAAVAVVDQLVTPAITPFIIGAVAVAVIFYLHPLQTAGIYLLAYVAFFLFLPLTQADPEILLSNRINGLTAATLGFLVSFLMWRANYSKLEQEVVISEQKNELIQKNEELEQQANELVELNATKDKFFSIIAHDLKSPFNSILGLSEILSDQAEKGDFSNTGKISGLVYNSAKQTLDLLTNLLEWSQAQTGRMEFNPESINLSELIAETVELFDHMARQKQINLKTKLPATLMVKADKAMISTVIRNLLSNAIKFTNPDGQVEVEARLSGSGCVVVVHDNGIGMDDASRAKLFNIGESFSTTGTANEKGTGLGLVLCKEFVEQHGGEIIVESENGKGSRFSFSLPNN